MVMHFSEHFRNHVMEMFRESSASRRCYRYPKLLNMLSTCLRAAVGSSHAAGLLRGDDGCGFTPGALTGTAAWHNRRVGRLLVRCR